MLVSVITDNTVRIVGESECVKLRVNVSARLGV